jgi:thiamine pyrophosphokinase
MDSLPAARLKALGSRAVKVDEQDYNDLNKAFLWLLENFPQVTDIHILGATGKSEAHALGNLSYLMFWEQEHELSARGIRLDMVSDYNTAFAVTDSCDLHVGEGRKVSLFSPDGTLRISSSGLQWATDGVRFDFWFRGTLNRASSDVISLRFNHPAPALIFLD